MSRVVQVVATSSFAGVERYVSEVSLELARRGWEVTVVGGDPRRMPRELGSTVHWRSGSNAYRAALALVKLGHHDICHVHMTAAEAAAVATRGAHRARIVSTRHFARHRGSSGLGVVAARWIEPRLARQIAVSRHVADHVEAEPDAVVLSGVRPAPLLWSAESRVVLVLQRLEPEKDTMTALRAWRESRLASEGWTLRVVGDGSERHALEAWVRAEAVEGVEFAGSRAEVGAELARAGIVLAPSRAEGFGLTAVEAMAAGVPVVASAAGGHAETVGRVDTAQLFEPGDAAAAAAVLRRFLAEGQRRAASQKSRAVVEQDLTLSRHVDGVVAQYEAALSGGNGPPPRPKLEIDEIVVCSLEPWDEVWRRNQFLVDQLLRRNPRLRVFFVEPASDVLFDLWNRRRPARPRLRVVGYEGRLRAFRPLKPLPRRLGGLADAALLRQVEVAARLAGFSRPVLWINDVSYAPLIERTGWPSIYDVTDDWLLTPFQDRELARLRKLDAIALKRADKVVVCSDALAASRSATRPVTLIPNAVDVEHFRRQRQRPRDLPASPVAIYVGSLHDARLDVDLLISLAVELPWLSVLLVGPDSLSEESRARIASVPNLRRLGGRPYDAVPAYLQHADVIVVPHRVTAFTDSLDPVKLYECLAVGTPTVATAVAGFRDKSEALFLRDRTGFIRQVKDLVDGRDGTERNHHASQIPTWSERAVALESVLAAIAPSYCG